MGGQGEITFVRWEAPIADAGPRLLRLCRRVFESFDDSYLLDRLPHLAEPSLWLAESNSEWVAFKLGYRRGQTNFYSWLGGVDPDHRRRGLAAELTRRQHEEAAANGYAHIETRTRAANNAMIIVNLRQGFHVAGFEVDGAGHKVVIQRKALR